MSLSNQEKNKLIKEYGQNTHDSGSVEVQVALLTTDINKLTDHFKTHTNDIHSRRGLIRKVNLRRKLLKYLKRKDTERYATLIKRLNIRG
ncbi:MAG: 30S ribosomal protein S15 [Gammaproteobacteria bacterium]